MLCFQRFDDGNSIAVVLNLSDDDLENYSIPNFPFEQCREHISDAEFTSPGHILTLALPRRTGYIFLSQ